MEKVIVKKIPHSYYGYTHHVVDSEQMMNIMDELVDTGVIDRYGWEVDFMQEYDLAYPENSEHYRAHTVWLRQTTTGKQSIFDVELFKMACRKGGIDVEIKEMK